MGESAAVQSARPLVSVITPTYSNNAVLSGRCIPSVVAQTYQPIEHIIVVDGPNDLPETDTPTRRIVHLGRNWHSFTPEGSWGSMARLVGSGLCRGDYIGYLDHDDELLPHHVADLVALLEETDSDFVFGKMTMMRQGYTWPFDRVIGSAPPRFCHISQDSVIHKAELWHIANSDPYCRWNKAHLPAGEQIHATYASDWDMIGRWMEASAKWAFLDKVTMIHHRDNQAELDHLMASAASPLYPYAKRTAN